MERKAYVYVGKDTSIPQTQPQQYKIGSTYNVAQRKGCSYIGDVLVTIECADRTAAFALEFRLHKYFSYRAVPDRNEWFYLTDSEVEAIRNGLDGTVVITDFMLMVAYHHMNRHDSAAERFRLRLPYVRRIEQIRCGGGYYTFAKGFMQRQKSGGES